MFRNFFKDSQSRVVVWQRPNLPLIVWFVAMIAAKVLPESALTDVLELLSFGALFTWAWLEIFQGASYFRRTLGAIVLTVTIISRL